MNGISRKRNARCRRLRPRSEKESGENERGAAGSLWERRKFRWVERVTRVNFIPSELGQERPQKETAPSQIVRPLLTSYRVVK